MSTTSTLSVTTDLLDYAPASTAYITATDASLGGTVEFEVLHVVDPGLDGIWGTLDDTLGDNSGGGHTPWIVTDGGPGDLDGIVNGVIQTSWYVDPDDSLGATFRLTATDAGKDAAFGTPDDVVATATFTDSVQTSYVGWENLDLGTHDLQWAGGAINTGQGLYLEGDVVPHAVSFTGLTSGQTYSFIINFDYYQANSNAGGYVLIDSYDASVDPSLVFPSGSGSPLADDTAMPVTGGLFYISDHGANGIDANVTSVVLGAAPSVSGSDATRQVEVFFTANGTAATFYYGLRLALPDEVGAETSGADGFTGGSLQSNVQNGSQGDPIGGGGNVQLFPGAVTQGSISGYKWSDTDGDGDWDADEAGLGGWTIQLYLDDGDFVFDPGVDGDQLVASELTSAALADLGFYEFAPVLRGTYFVTEVQQNGWTQTYPESTWHGPLTISELTPTWEDIDFGNRQQNPSLTILKNLTNADDSIVDTAGETIEFTITVQNTGNVDLTNVQVDDLFAGGATYVSGDTSNPGVLDTDETWTYTADYVLTQDDLNDGDPLVNVAVVDTDQTAPQQDDATSNVDQDASLTIVKSLTNANDSIVDTAGETIEYTITVRNTGNVDLTNVQVDDVFAGGATYVSGDTSNPGVLDTDETWTYTADYVVTQDDLNAGDPLVNVAVVDTDQTAPQQDDATSTVDQNPSLTIVKSLTDADDAFVDTDGETIEYTITVQNTGNVDLTNVQVDDLFAGGATYVSGDTSNPGVLDTDETWTYTADYVVTQGDLNDGDPLVNVAVVDTDQTAPQQDDATSNVRQGASLTIVKSLTNAADGVVDTAGETIEYTITVQNTGNVDLTDVQVDDVFAGGATYVSGDTSNPGVLDTDETWIYTADYVVTQEDLNDGANLVNVAGVTTDQTTRQTDDAGSTVDQNPALTIVKSLTNANDAIVDTAGETIEYTITVQNTGNVDLTNVVLVDPFADGASYQGGDDGDGILETKETWTYTADYLVTQDDLNAGTPLVNVAVVDTDQTAPQQDDATSTVDQNPSLTIVKSLTNANDAIVDTADETIEYTITVQNTGNVDLTSVQVDDLFAGAATYVSGDVSNTGVLDTDETWTYTADYVVTQDDLNGGSNLVNVAGVTTDQTPRQTDDASSTVDQNPALTISKSGAWIDGDGDDYADPDELINYSVVVTNIGNVTLHNVVIDDPLVTNFGAPSGDNGNGLLDVGEAWTYTGSYSVTQADIDRGSVYNLATARAVDPNDDPVTEDDDHTEDLPQNPLLSIIKTGAWVDGSVDGIINGRADPGEAINYTFTVSNDGNVTLHDVTVTDTVGGVTVNGGPTTLDVGETDSTTFTGVYYITADDIEAGNFHNLATADSTQSDPAEDTEDVFLPNPRISLDKTGTWIDGDGDGYANPGDVIDYTFAIKNTGNLVLDNVTLTDAYLGDEAPVLDGSGFNVGDTEQDGLLGLGETWYYTGSYVIDQYDIDLGSVYNEALATAADPGGYPVTDTDDNTEQLPQNPDLDVTKTVLGIFDIRTLDPMYLDADQIADLGDWISYEIVVANSGNVTLKDVEVWDRVLDHAPVRLYLAGDSNQNGINDGIEDWSADGDLDDDGELDVGETWTYRYDYQVTQDDIDATADLAWRDEGIAAEPLSADGAFFYSGTQPPATGSGLIDSFVRIQDSNSNNGVDNRRKDGIQEGYNTDYRPQQFDEDNTATFNHSLRVGDVPILTIDGKQYLEFRLDSNELDSKLHPSLTLVDLRIFTTSDPYITGFDPATGFGSDAKIIFDLDTPILLNDWSTGSGHGDYAVAIPIVGDLDPADYIVLYSKFSDVDGGFEEWYVRPQPLIVNKVSVTAETLYTQLQASGSASAAVEGNGFADLTVDKVGTVHSSNGTIDYVVTIENTGNSTLADVVVTDAIEGGWEFVLNGSNATLTESLDANGVIDVGETWTYRYTVTYGQGNIDVDGDEHLTNVVKVDTDKTHPSTASSTDNIGALAFFGPSWALNAHSADWWKNHKTAWDGNLKSNQHDGLVGTSLSSHDVLLPVDSNKSGTLTPSDASGILIGDINANGLIDAGETTLFVSLGIAQQILASSSPDLRMAMIKEAIAAQLNINNMAGDSTVTNSNEGPSNLVGEAAMWLRGLGPYTYNGSTGKIDTNGDGLLSDGGSNNFEFNKNSGTFTNDTNGGSSGTNLTEGLAAWATGVLVFDRPDPESDIFASGQGLVHALQSFNGASGLSDIDPDGHLVVSPHGNKIGWYDGIDVVGVVNNSADAFWGVLDAYNVV